MGDHDQVMETPDSGQHHNSGRVFIGIIIIVIGLAMLADRTGFEDIHLSSHLWPLFLIALGVSKLIEPPVSRHGKPRSRRAGVWLLWVGGWGLVSEFHVFGLDYNTSWPLLIVGAGLLTIWRAIENPGGRDRVRES